MNTSRLLERFFRYVSCDSESGNEKKFCELLEAELEALGLTVSRQEVGEKCGSNGWNVYAFLEGEGAPILFSAHLDTVPPGIGVEPVLEDGIIRSKGDTILGADDKAGIAAVLEAIEVIQEEKLSHRPIEVLFSVCEEMGLLGAKHADYSQIKSKEAVVLDNGTVGEMINQAPAKLEAYVEIIGKSAHAAVAPSKGISAIKVAAAAINEIPCGLVEGGAVMNVANLLSPGKSNVVPEKASFNIDMRAFDADHLRALLQQVEDKVKAACEAVGASYKLEVDWQADPLLIPVDSPVIARLKEVYAELGIEPSVTKTYGGSDATWLFLKGGIHAVNVGTGMVDVHSTDECIALSDLESTTRLVLRMMRAG